MPEAIDPQEHEQEQQQPAPSSEPCLEPAARSPKIIRLRRRNLENIVLQSEPELALTVAHCGGVRALAARKERYR
jgi:hypothetical protein